MGLHLELQNLSSKTGELSKMNDINGGKLTFTQLVPRPLARTSCLSLSAEKILWIHLSLILFLAIFSAGARAQSLDVVAEQCVDEEIYCIVLNEIGVFAEGAAQELDYQRLLPSVLAIALIPNSNYRLLTQNEAIVEGGSVRNAFRSYGDVEYIDGVEFELEIEFSAIGGEMFLLGYIQSTDGEWNELIESEIGNTTDILEVANMFSLNMSEILDRQLLAFTPRKIVLTCFRSNSSPDSGIDYFSRDLNDAIFAVADSLPEYDVESSDFGGESCRYEGDRIRTLTADGVVDAVLFGDISVENDRLRSELTLFIDEEDQFYQLAVVDTSIDTYLDHKFRLQKLAREYLGALLSDEYQWNLKILTTTGRSVFNVLPFISRVGTLLNDAESSLQEGDLETAAVLAQDAINLNPRTARGHYILGQTRFQQQLWQEAVEELDEALLLDSNYIEVSLLLGQSYERLRLMDLAIEVYEEILQRDSDNYAANLSLGKALYNERRYEEAKGFITEAASLEPDSIEPYLQLISISNALNEWDLALAWSVSALEVDRDDSVAQRRFTTAVRREINSYFNSREYSKAYDDAVLWTTFVPSAEAFFFTARSYARAFSFGQIESDDGYNPAIDAYRMFLDLNENQDSVANMAILGMQELMLLEARYDEIVEYSNSLLAPAANEEVIALFHVVAALILDDASYEEGAYLDKMEALNERLEEFDFASLSLSWSFDLVRRNLLEDSSSNLSDAQSQLLESLIDRMELPLF